MKRDRTTGTYQFGMRVYDPKKGGFLTPDSYRAEGGEKDLSIGVDPLTRNRYSYVNGDPLNFVDPDGHVRKEVWRYLKFCIKAGLKRRGCLMAINITTKVGVITEKLYGDAAVKEGPGNTFRHVLWAAALTVALGAKFAQAFMGLHEKEQRKTDPPEDLRVDAFNNRAGVRIGLSMLRSGHKYSTSGRGKSTLALLVKPIHYLVEHRARTFAYYEPKES